MAPSLIVVAGPMHGDVLELSDAGLTIGRDSSNDLHPPDLSLSRHHCALTVDATGRVTLADLDSLNGTFVNGAPIKTRVLEHGDQLKIGESQFMFLQRDAATSSAASSIEAPAAQPTVQIKKEDVLYLQSEQMVEAFSPALRDGRTLEGLLRFSRALASAATPEDVYRALFDGVLALLPADHAAIVWSDAGEADFSSVPAHWRWRDPSMPISRTIVARVLADGVAVLSTNPAHDERLRDARSVAGGTARSILCVPIVTGGTAEGVLYVASTEASAELDEVHLQLLTAIAGIAAMAFRNVHRITRLERDAAELRVQLSADHSLIGDSAPMQAVYRTIAKAAKSDATVLILGESGTGKEMAARDIHENSARARQPFVAINASELAESLLESELFGHEKGAFTGAVAQKKGKLEVAAGGTIFLDEIGDLAAAVQVKLLRVLQEREVTRVGGTRPIKIDVRFIAATNADLDAAVKRGTFRQDLFYRVNVIALRMPPLRERPEDIPLLAAFFGDRHARKCKRRVAGITPEARACLMRHDWPGNVRELDNAIERAVVLGSSDRIEVDDLPETILESAVCEGAAVANYHESLQAAKRRIVLEAFARASDDHAEAARLLGIHPNNLHRLIRQLGLRKSTD